MEHSLTFLLEITILLSLVFNSQFHTKYLALLITNQNARFYSVMRSSVEPSVSEEILLENNNITVSCKQICPEALHFHQSYRQKE